MEEKIKIYLPESVYRILLKDAELFEFYKKSGEINRNDFFNTLIVSYYDTFSKENSDIYNHICEVLDKTGLKSSIKAETASEIFSYFEKEHLNLEDKRSDVTISLKPTRFSRRTIDLIMDSDNGNLSLSNYFRNMFASYTLLPQDKRERIIFKETFETIEEAIRENKKIRFRMVNNPGNRHVVSPYELASSKEELFNYLLGEEHDKSYSFRVSRIINIAKISETVSFSQTAQDMFERMKKEGPQYRYSDDDDGSPIRVYLNENGKRKYRSIYLHRPRIVSVEEDIYTFNCSSEQAFQYFSRFGKDAVVLEPKSLNANLYYFYKNGFGAYRISNTDKKQN